jgi:hypothetical protein
MTYIEKLKVVVEKQESARQAGSWTTMEMLTHAQKNGLLLFMLFEIRTSIEMLSDIISRMEQQPSDPDNDGSIELPF